MSRCTDEQIRRWADVVTPNCNMRSYTLRSVPPSHGRSFFYCLSTKSFSQLTPAPLWRENFPNWAVKGDTLHSCAIWHQSPMGRYGGVVESVTRLYSPPLKKIILIQFFADGGRFTWKRRRCDLESPFEEGWPAPPPPAPNIHFIKYEIQAERICTFFGG